MSKYKQEDLERAMEAVKNGEMPQRKTSERLEVSLPTLNHTINQKYGSNGPDMPSVLSLHTELMLVTFWSSNRVSTNLLICR